MTTTQIHSEVSLAELLNGVKRLDTVALESFADEVLAIRAQRRAPTLSQEAAELLLKINQGLPMAVHTRFVELNEKRRAETLTESFSIEHIIPLAQGGDNTLSNLALACQGRNGHKHSKVTAPDPLDGTSLRLYHPRKQQWHEHFSCSKDHTQIIGLTPVGRATVEALKMNLLNLRRVLYVLGEHPPRYRQV